MIESKFRKFAALPAVSCAFFLFLLSAFSAAACVFLFFFVVGGVWLMLLAGGRVGKDVLGAKYNR